MNLKRRFRGRRATQSLQEDWATRGRRWPAAACRVDFVAGTALREPEVQAGGLGGHAAAAGPRLVV